MVDGARKPNRLERPPIWPTVDRRALVNVLTLARLPFAGLGTWTALTGDALSTVTFGLAAVATDIGDGMLARRWNVETEWGSNFDSVMDVIFYALLVYWVYHFQPQAILDHVGLLATFSIAYALLLLAGHALERSIAQHDRVSRAAGTVGGLTAFWFISFGYHEWMLFTTALFATADIAHRLHGAVQVIARKRRGLEGS